ncbi:MAG TPA: response regulator [Hyphomonadaceae bacterium]|jgi:CheY-like chemotaxis protein|nr:response regulator [Hyphomonadaceae bacterium]
MAEGIYREARAPDETRPGAQAALKVLIVEDMFLNSEFLRIWVEALGHEVCGVAVSVETACALARTQQPDVILMDLLLEGEGDGVDAAMEIRRTQAPSIIFITACSEQKSVERILSTDPFRILPKPVNPQELFDALRAAERTRAAAA